MHRFFLRTELVMPSIHPMEPFLAVGRWPIRSMEVVAAVAVVECCVHGSLWRCRVREISTDVLVTGTKFFPSLTDAATMTENIVLVQATRSDVRD
jgi:hypothetical protein